YSTYLKSIYQTLLSTHKFTYPSTTLHRVTVGSINHVYDAPSGGSSTFHIRLIATPPAAASSDTARKFIHDTTATIHSITITDSHQRLILNDAALTTFAKRVTTRIPPVNNRSCKAQGIITNLPPSIFGDRRQATELLRQMLHKQYVTLSKKKKIKGDPMLDRDFFAAMLELGSTPKNSRVNTEFI
ncbi:MAG: hypothetical protein ACREOZ_03660, partial [Gloeomargaritales cyanobacterium]